MPYVPWFEIPNNPNLAPGTPLGDMLRGAAGLVNQVNDQFPDWARPVPPILDPVGEGVSQLANQPRLIPRPQLPFTGGQCCGTTYAITYNYVAAGVGQTVSAAVTGKIGGPQIISGADGTLASVVPVTRCDGVVQLLLSWANVGIEAYQSGEYRGIIIDSVEPLFGTDDCGDPLPIFPPDIPTADDLTIIIPIVISPTLTIPVNFVYVRPEIDVNADVDLNFNIPVTVNLPDFNMNFSFDVGGVNINIGSGGNTTVLPTKPDPRDPKPVAKPTPTGNDSDFLYIINQLRRIKEVVDDTKECACGTPTITQTVSYPAANSRVISLPAKAFLVRMTLTETPTNIRKQNGMDAPDVVYAGWAAFGYAGGGWEDRQPIDYAEKAFIPPREAQGFSYTCQVGCKASLIVYYEVETS